MRALLAGGLSTELIAVAALLALVVLAGIRRLLSSSNRERPAGGKASVPNKIDLIRRYREHHGVSLKEAKEAVEAELDGRKLGTPNLVPSGPSQETLESLLRAERKIEAIKRYRDQHGVGLKEAKDAVEALSAQIAARGGGASHER